MEHGEQAWMKIPGLAVFRFDRERFAVTAFPEAQVDPDQLHDNYYRAALPMALQFFGFEVLHAGAVRTSRGVVGFCAVSETGKSTTVAELSRRGYPAWADDAVPVAIDDDGGGVNALAVPFRIRLKSIHSFGDDQGFRRWSDPVPVEFHATPLVGLCVMDRVASSEKTAVRRLSAVEAVAALLPHAYCFSLANPQRKRVMMQRYIELAARIPTFAISISTGLEKLPAALDQIENSIPGFTQPSV